MGGKCEGQGPCTLDMEQDDWQDEEVPCIAEFNTLDNPQGH